MTEKEREEEIYHRAERREMLKTRFLIQKKIKEQQKLEKRKALHNKNKDSKNHHSTASNNVNENLSASSSNLNLSTFYEKTPSQSNTTEFMSEADTISMERRKANENRKK
jgi:hypothetical protein